MNITFSESVTKRINDLSIQPGSNFMNGEYTSGLASGVVNAAATILQAGPLIAEITTSCATQVTNELLSYSVDAIGKIVTSPMTKVYEEINSYTTALTYNPQDIIKNLTTGWDQVINQAADAAQQSAFEKITEKMNEKSKNISYNTQNTVQKINEGIKTITAYISQGPDWIKKQLSNYCSIAITESEKAIGGIVNDFENSKNEWVNSTAYFIAAKIAKPINDGIESSLKRANEAIDEAKNAAKNGAKAAVETTIMMMVGLLGT